MNIFHTHEGIIKEYKSYIESFINIKKDNIREAVAKSLETGKLWPQPLIQFNPIYKPGKTVDQLVQDRVLHPGLQKLFKGYRLYHHQVEALTLSAEGNGFIVTSGTGSGKSLTFLGTIFNSLLKNPGQEGIKAILIYPMNALINSQTAEIEKYAENFGPDFPITFAQYTGQERQEERERIKANPPDILLTNYMMLELLLTRDGDRNVRDAIYKGLRFLVYDELHTFRGRQGSDVAILNRRLKALCTHSVMCMGTSATMVSGGTLFDQKKKVADVASTFFGSAFTPKQVVVEQLEPSLTKQPVAKETLANRIKQGIPSGGGYDALAADPLAQWLEQFIALKESEENFIEREKPQTLESITQRLEEATGLSEEACEQAIIEELEWISKENVAAAERDQKPILPYKLHQFISQTGSVYGTLDQEPEKQNITLESGRYDETEDHPKLIYPLVFSRETGQEFYCVTLDTTNEQEGLAMLCAIFDQKLIPQLREYFFGDYGKIALVLGNAFVVKQAQDEMAFAKNVPVELDEFSERPIYRFTKPNTWSLEDFLSVYG